MPRPLLLPNGSYGYFTREVENQHGTPCNGHRALLSAGNDLSLNAVRESKNSRNGRSESHDSHAAVSTVTAGDNLLLVAGRDVALTTATESDYHYLETFFRYHFLLLALHLSISLLPVGTIPLTQVFQPYRL